MPMVYTTSITEVQIMNIGRFTSTQANPSTYHSKDNINMVSWTYTLWPKLANS